MKKIVVVLAAVLMALVPVQMKADSYQELLKQYLTYSGQMNAANMQEQLQAALSQSVPAEEAEQVSKILAEYAQQQMGDDLTEIYLPTFRKYVSEADLKALIQLYSDERYVELNNRAVEGVSKLQENPYFKGFMASFQKSLEAIMKGEKPTDVPAPAKISESYKQAFHRYYDMMGMDDMMKNMFGPVMNMIRPALEKENVPNVDAVLNDLSAYIMSNMETIVLIIFSSSYTEDDLTYLLSVSDTEAGRHCMAAVAEAVSNPFAMAAQVIGKMTAWLKVHYPDYGKQMEQVLQAIQSFNGQ